MNIFTLDVIGLFTSIMGYIVGLGAVTVIDLHGFLGRKSAYWTEATTRTHKITKPLIWIGISLVIIGGIIFYRNNTFLNIPLFQSLIAIILILNGLFLSFRVSPFLLEREAQNKSSELLPKSWQNKITVSFVVSFLGWWTSLLLLVVYTVSHFVS
jgi:hypothetical protein